jgi:hypothetical protein
MMKKLLSYFIILFWILFFCAGIAYLVVIFPEILYIVAGGLFGIILSVTFILSITWAIGNK